MEKENKLLKLQNKILSTSIVQNGLKDFFQKLRVNKPVKNNDSNLNSNCDSGPSPYNSNVSSLKKSFTDLKVINSEIFEKLNSKTEKLIQEEFKKCFHKMKLNSKTTNNKFFLRKENKYNIEYTDSFNKFEENYLGKWSISTVSFSLIPKRIIKEQFESER